MNIAIVAGEASGDLLGSGLIRTLRRQRPDLVFSGIGGPRMEAAGMQVLFPMEKLAVRGYVEVIRSLREILAIRRALLRTLRAHKPALYIGIDAPDFNLGVERKLRACGVPTVHYVSPAIWAWRGERIRQIRQAVSKMLTLFPFEAPLYERAGVAAAYVGHPLADMLHDYPSRETVREQLRLHADVPVVALLPGSRQSEIELMAESFIGAARRIADALPGTRFLVPLASRETRALFETALHRHDAAELPVTVMFGHAHDAMAAADVVLAASGTATLEAALLMRPMVVAYRVSKLTARMVRRRGRVPYVALPNILAGEFIVPEFLQEDATAENLAQAVLNVLRDRTVRERVVRRFETIAGTLRQDNAARVADAILPMLPAA
ncbi:MAG TPA: lipid-A-disaccharide synthase [Burkholderiales bacterium]|nr:lipid-A-disaccharide synthase [Burkholderiales bacterium]